MHSHLHGCKKAVPQNRQGGNGFFVLVCLLFFGCLGSCRHLFGFGFSPFPSRPVSPLNGNGKEPPQTNINRTATNTNFGVNLSNSYA